MPSLDDAIQFLIEILRDPNSERVIQNYGYDLYITRVCNAYAERVERIAIQDAHAIRRRANELTPVFYEAAWYLCRRGIIRPGVRQNGVQATDDGSAGNGYSITSLGRQWLDDADHLTLVPIEPSRVATLLAGFRDEFGEGFFQRAQEAIKCHSAQAYLATCSMCGAAAESILLSLAIEKKGNEEQVLATYQSARGRSRITQKLLQGQPDRIANSFRELTALLNYWRDAASHGTASDISEFEAYEAIARLLRFAHFASEHRDDLISN